MNTLTEKQEKGTGKNTNKILVETEINGLPPSVNGIWRSSHKTWRVFKTTEAKKWQEEAIKTLKQNKTNKIPFDDKTCMILEIYTKTKRRMDIDNRIKAIQDCLAPAGIIYDDSQIWDLKVKRIMSNEDFTKITILTKEEQNGI